MERRLLADNPTLQDVAEIMMELTRLQEKFHMMNHEYIPALQKYYQLTTNCAIYYERAIKSDFVIDPVVAKIEGGLKLLNNEQLGYRQFYCHIIESDDENITDMRQKYPREFELMFKKLFELNYPKGIQAVGKDNYMYCEYQSISNEFGCVDFLEYNGHQLPEIHSSVFNRQFVFPIAQTIASVLLKVYHKDQKSSFKKMLPSSEKLNYSKFPDTYPQHQYQVLDYWKESILKKKGEITIFDVIEFTSYAELQGGFKKPQWDRAVEKFSNSGFGLIPELSLFLDYAKFDEPVTLIDIGLKNSDWKEPSIKYFSVLISVALGFLILGKNGSITKEQKAVLEKYIKRPHGLKRIEKTRLTHNYQRMLKSPPFPQFIPRLGRYKKLIDPDIVRPFLVKCASMGNPNNAQTVSMMETIYKRIGIDSALVYSDLHAEESISQLSEKRSKNQKTRELDLDKIVKIRNETEQVSEVLGGIFNDNQAASSTINCNLIGSLGLDNKHEMLVRSLVLKSDWTESEFENLAKQQGLLSAGALEALNEWAFDKFEVPLIDEYDGYHLDVDIAEKIKLELAGEKLAA